MPFQPRISQIPWLNDQFIVSRPRAGPADPCPAVESRAEHGASQTRNVAGREIHIVGRPIHRLSAFFAATSRERLNHGMRIGF